MGWKETYTELTSVAVDDAFLIKDESTDTTKFVEQQNILGQIGKIAYDINNERSGLIDPASSSWEDGGWWGFKHEDNSLMLGHGGTSNGEVFLKQTAFSDDTFRYARSEIGAEDDAYDAGVFVSNIVQINKDGTSPSAGISVGTYNSDYAALRYSESNGMRLEIEASIGQTDPLIKLLDENGNTVFTVGPDGTLSHLLPLGNVSGSLSETSFPGLYVSSVGDPDAWLSFALIPGVNSGLIFGVGDRTNSDAVDASVSAAVTTASIQVEEYNNNGYARMEVIGESLAHIQVRAVESQTDPIFELKNESGTSVFSIGPNGFLTVPFIEGGESSYFYLDGPGHTTADLFVGCTNGDTFFEVTSNEGAPLQLWAKGLATTDPGQEDAIWNNGGILTRSNALDPAFEFKLGGVAASTSPKPAKILMEHFDGATDREVATTWYTQSPNNAHNALFQLDVWSPNSGTGYVETFWKRDGATLVYIAADNGNTSIIGTAQSGQTASIFDLNDDTGNTFLKVLPKDNASHSSDNRRITFTSKTDGSTYNEVQTYWAAKSGDTLLQYAVYVDVFGDNSSGYANLGIQGPTGFFQLWSDTSTSYLQFGPPTGGSAYVQFGEGTAPSGASNAARLFSRDNGSGKTQLCVIFPTGAVQVLSTEP